MYAEPCSHASAATDKVHPLCEHRGLQDASLTFIIWGHPEGAFRPYPISYSRGAARRNAK